MTQLPLIMLCTDKDQWLKAQYCSEWTKLWYVMLVRFLCSEMTMMTKRRQPIQDQPSVLGADI